VEANATWPNGNHYRGGWMDGKPHGIGVLYNKSGMIIHKGLFKDGQIVEFSKHTEPPKNNDIQLDLGL